MLEQMLEHVISALYLIDWLAYTMSTKFENTGIRNAE